MSLPDTRTIEAELQASVDRLSDGVARASLFNLVLFDDVTRPSRLAAAVDSLLGKRPARILHIQSGYDGETEAHVSARCYPDRRNRGVCFEEVRILNGSDNIGLDPGAWSALLIRELPVFGLAADPVLPLASQVSLLSDIADKVILDSAETDPARPWEIYADLASASRGQAEQREGAAGVPATPKGPGVGAPQGPAASGRVLALADLAWLRMLDLRRAIARAFEHEKARGLWAALTAVDVTGGPFAEAALLALWLAGRLGWRPAGASRSEAAFEDARGIGVRFSHSRAEGARRVSLIMDGGESIEIATGQGALRVRQVDGSRSESALREAGAGSILLHEVDSQRGDPLYHEAIAGAAALRERG
jgi:hypothetical protein